MTSFSDKLLEAEDSVDSGDIWGQEKIFFEGHELLEEINFALFAAEIKLIDFAITNIGNIKPRPQGEEEPTYYPRRKPNDSILDMDKSIREQFNLLRVSDPVRYPAYFEFAGYKYAVKIEKIKG